MAEGKKFLTIFEDVVFEMTNKGFKSDNSWNERNFKIPIRNP